MVKQNFPFKNREMIREGLPQFCEFLLTVCFEASLYPKKVDKVEVRKTMEGDRNLEFNI